MHLSIRMWKLSFILIISSIAYGDATQSWTASRPAELGKILDGSWKLRAGDFSSANSEVFVVSRSKGVMNSPPPKFSEKGVSLEQMKSLFNQVKLQLNSMKCAQFCLDGEKFLHPTILERAIIPSSITFDINYNLKQPSPSEAVFEFNSENYSGLLDKSKMIYHFTACTKDTCGTDDPMKSFVTIERVYAVSKTQSLAGKVGSRIATSDADDFKAELDRFAKVCREINELPQEAIEDAAMATADQ